jgi:hypothetical protein
MAWCAVRTLECETELLKTCSQFEKCNRFLLPQHFCYDVFDKMALTVKIVHWELNTSLGLGLNQGENNTMAGGQKLSQLDTIP